jgi:Type IX secretion system membrane protein PorP/SprF
MRAITKNIKQMRRVTFLFAAGTLFLGTVKAQMLPLNAQYFQNRYLVNPSMAGITEGFNINGSFRKQWSNIPGAPITQSVTLDQQVNKLGWGVNIYNEKSGGTTHQSCWNLCLSPSFKQRRPEVKLRDFFWRKSG